MKPFRPFAAFAALTISLLAFTPALTAAPGDLDPAFLTGIGAGLTPNSYPTFDSGTGAVNAVALQSTGRIIAGGNISKYNNTGTLSALKRLNADGTLDTTFNPGGAGLANGSSFQPEVNALLVTPDDKIYVGGTYASYNGTGRNGILRLNADGTLDTTFAYVSVTGTNQYVAAIARQPDGKILIGGGFTSINSTYSPNLARLNADGTRDTTFSGPAYSNQGATRALALAPDGKIYVGGVTYNSATQRNEPILQRLNPDGSRDNTFNPSFGNDYGTVHSLLVLPDGRLAVGGTLLFPGYADHVGLAVFTPGGALDPAFMTNLAGNSNGDALTLALSADGRILAGGIFTEFAGQTTASIARIGLDGTIDPTFAPVPYKGRDDGYITHFYSFAVQPDGRIVVGGWFDHISDPARAIYNLARFEGDTGPGAGTIALLSPAFTVNENNGTATISVARFGGVASAVSVSYTTAPGTADSADFTAASGTLSWLAGEGGVKTFTVAITNDSAAESTEFAALTLSSPTGGAALSRSAASLAIRDDDSIPSILVHPIGGNVDQGDSFAFAVAFDSVLATTIQWQFDSGSGFNNIPGATGLVYTISVADLAAHTGSYRVLVTNANGTATSTTASLVVKIPAGALVPSFNPGSGSLTQVISAGLDPAGNILVGGANGLLRLTSSGVIDPSFTTTANSAINSIIVLPDGSSLVAGAFTTINSTAQNYFAHINVNGTLDSAANLGLTQAVNVISLGAGNKLYVGQGSQGLKRFTLTGATGTLDSSFVTTGLVTGTQGTVFNVKERADGKVFLSSQSGANGFGFTYQFRLLTSTGAIDPSFTAPTLNWTVHDWEVLPDGRTVIVGRFTTINGVTSKGIAVLKPDGSVDTSFNFTNAFTGALSGIRYVNGRFLVWGGFTAFGGTTLNGIARLNPDGTLDPTFKIGTGANTGGLVNTVVVLPDQRLFLGGNFTSMRSVARTRTALLEAGPSALGVAPSAYAVTESAGSVAVTVKRFAPATGAVSVTYTTTNDTATAPGDYTTTANTLSWAANDTTDRTITIPLTNDATGEPVESFTLNLNASSITGEANLFAPTAIIVITDDDNPPAIVTPPQTQTVNQGATATFTVVATATPAATYRWTFNGTDLNDGAGISGATTATLTITNAGPTHIGAYRVRLTNSNGSVTSDPAQLAVNLNPAYTDHTWPTNLTVNGRVNVILPLPDGSAYVGGQFTNFNGQTGRSYLVKINAAGVVDPTFSPAPNGYVLQLRLVDNVLYVLADFTGPFSTIGGGAAVTGFAALDATTGARLASFMTNLGTGATSFTNIRALAVAPDGDIVLGGDFTTFNNNANHRYLARLNPDGTIDSEWNTSAATPTSGSSLVVTALDVGPDGKTVAGGTIAHQGGSRLIRFNRDGSRDSTFAPAVNVNSTTLTRIKVLADGRVLATGSTLPGGRTIVRLGVDGSWTSGDFFGQTSGSNFYDAALQRNGRTLGVGQFSFVRQPSGTFNNIARFDLTGTLEQAWPTGTAFDGVAYALALAEDGKIWVGGDFLTYNGATAQRLIRLNGDAIPLGITLQPKSLDVNPGATVVFKARATGTSTITYEWRKAGTPLTNGGRITGADTAELTIANATEADEAAYTLRVTNTSGEEISSAAQLVVLGAPEILAEPSATGIAFGNRAFVLTVSARGVAPLTYQWRKAGVPLVEGANGITGTATDRLTFANLAPTDAGEYDVVITNTSGTATSVKFNLVVTAHPLDRHPTFASLAGTNPTTLYSILPLPDGGALLGGSFNSIQGANSTASAGRLARVLPNGQIATLSFALNGNVRSMARQPDGKILLGGEFTLVTPTGQSSLTRNRLLRLNADFTLDTSFDVGAGAPSEVINSLKLDSLGRIYAGGSFASWGGRPFSGYLVRLRPDGSFDASFNASLNNYVNDLELDATGRLYVAGQFTNYQGGSQLVRLNADGSRDTSFTNPIYASVMELEFQPDGKLLALYQSTGLRRLTTDTGALDATFPAITVNGVSSLAVQSDGQIILTGSFTSYNGYARLGLVRLAPDGTVDPVLNPAGTSNGLVRVDAYGRLWFGGNFTVFNNTIVRGVYVMNGDAIPLGFALAPVSQTVEAGQTATFTALATGTSTITYRWLRNGSELTDGGAISGATTNTLTIANVQVTDEANYALRLTNLAGTKTSPAAELVILGQPEILIAPTAQNLEVGQTATFYVNARGAGTLAYQWLKHGITLVNGGNVSGATSSALTLSPLALTDGSAYSVRITGSAGTTTSTPVTLAVTLNPAGVSRSVNLPTFNNTISALLPNSDGTFFAGGAFTSLTWTGGSGTRNRFAKIKADGSPDTAWPTFNSQVYAIAKDGTGRVYVGGAFTQITPNGGSAVTRNRLVRLNADGSLDTTFNAPGGTAAAGPNSQVKGIKLDATGRVYIYGEFSTYNGTAANYLARLNADGSLDTGFTSATNSFVYDLEFTSDGRLWIAHGGNWGGQYSVVLTDAAGVKDPGFSYTGNLTPKGLALLADNSVINVSNNWPYLQKISLTGATASGFPATDQYFQGPNSGISLHEVGGSQVYLHGPSISSYGTLPVPNILRINADGSRDTTFAPGTGAGFNGTVETMVVDGQGRLWAGGSFTSYNGDTTLARLVVLNGGEAATYSGPPPDPFGDFLTSAGVPEGQRGPNDDPDGDSVANLLEYALALDPMVASTTGLPEVLVVSNRLTFVYERVRADVTYTVETSTDLTTWTATGVDQGTPDGEGVTTASVAMDVPSRFLRLKIERATE